MRKTRHGEGKGKQGDQGESVEAMKREITHDEWAAAWEALTLESLGTPRAKFLVGLWRSLGESPKLFKTFERFAFEAKDKGRTRFSANMIFNRIRWYTQVESSDGTEFKLNDHYSALLARFFVLLHPECRDLFEFRERSARA